VKLGYNEQLGTGQNELNLMISIIFVEIPLFFDWVEFTPKWKGQSLKTIFKRQEWHSSTVLLNFWITGADAIKNFTPSLRIPYLGVLTPR